MDLKDPAAFRALAHPLRLELFERLAILGTATASQLAEHVDESPANCSFHLRVLAKHGYIERVESDDARERPWRVVDVTQNWEADQPPESRLAAETLTDALLEWDNRRLRQALRSPRPEGWQGTMLNSRSTLWLTADEARSLASALHDLITPYLARWDTGERPAGGAPMRLITELFLVPDAGASEPGTAAATQGGEE